MSRRLRIGASLESGGGGSLRRGHVVFDPLAFS